MLKPTRRAFLLLAALLLPVAVPAQSLARPGWAGSGMKLEAWWLHAVFYQVDPHAGTGGLRTLTGQLDYIRSLGVDAITLAHLAPESGHQTASGQAVDPALGSFDDFDDLIREASRDNLRLIVELDPGQLADSAALAAAARFWLSRGAAGISVRAAAQPLDLAPLRKLVKSFAGQRILIDAAGRRGDADLTLNPTLSAVPRFDAALFRAAITQIQSSPEAATTLAFTDGSGFDRSAARYADAPNTVRASDQAKVLATLLLATRANAQLYAGQELGLAAEAAPTPALAKQEADPRSLLNWYRRLIDLHHGNATLRSGTLDLLPHDDQNAIVWVARRQPVTAAAPAIVVACNLSSKPVTLSLVDDLRNLHLRGSFLRTVLRSDEGMGGMNLTAVTLPPFGVYIGELRF